MNKSDNNKKPLLSRWQKVVLRTLAIGALLLFFLKLLFPQVETKNFISISVFIALLLGIGWTFLEERRKKK